jgi:integrase
LGKPLTDALLRAIKPSTGRVEMADAACRGLSLRVTAAGAKSFAFRYRPHGSKRLERVTLGAYPDVSLRHARDRADALRRQVADGENPSARRREAPTRSFAALADRYLSEHARRFKRSADKDERNLRLHVLPRWGDWDFARITRADVIALVERLISDGKPTLANHVQRLVSKIFAFAMDATLAEQNPAARLRLRGVARVKTRTLSNDEIRLFWSRVGEAPIARPVGLALKLVLATGVRPGEAAGMALSEIEFNADGASIAWTIPGARSKNRRPHYVPLSPLAAAIVREAREIAGPETAFVFTSRAERGHVDSSTLAATMARLPALLDNEKGAPSWKADPPTAHDLRRTTATRLAAAGVPAEDVAAILSHVRSDVTGRHYDQYGRANEKRAGLERWSRILAAILEPPTSNNVVTLR